MTKTRDYTYFDVLAAREIGPEAVNEASLSRVWQHTQKAGEKSFGILTSWRAALPEKTNESRFKELKGRIRSEGLGFFPLRGHWQECQDSKMAYAAYADCPKDQLVDAAEPSLFIPGISQELITELGTHYDQDAWLYAGPETDGKATLVFRDGGKQDLGPFHPNRIAQAYSELKSGSPFIFESVAYGWVDSLVESAMRRSPDVVRARADLLRAELVLSR